jgi:hypothetical protein
MLKILDKYGISTLQAYRDEAFSRNIGLLSKELMSTGSMEHVFPTSANPN